MFTDLALRFSPGVIWLSESKNHVVARDDRLAQEIGLTIQPDRNLPDLILVDLGPIEPLLVFVEVVATAGPVNESRQTALMAVATEAGFKEDQVAFVTAYADRDEVAFKSSVSELAWRSFVRSSVLTFAGAGTTMGTDSPDPAGGAGSSFMAG